MNECDFPGFADALDRAAEGLARSVVDGLTSAVSEALADPIVSAMMAADRVDRAGLEAMLHHTAAQLARRHRHDRQHQHLCGAGRG
jgi:hypothetical protein